MNAQSLTLTIMARSYSTDKIEVTEFIISELNNIRAKKLLPNRMVRRALKIQEKILKDLQNNL